MAKVRVIPSTINPLTQAPLGEVQKRKVAAYARVSTDSDEQYTSYEMQVKYYKKFILEHDGWDYVDVYADEGITGTNTKKRESFNQMIKDAMDGKIDLIVTKSISRFARNTLDTISITRKLKTSGVEVFFEKEGLWTFDSKSELILTIMASIAQEESRSISANVTMGKRWGMQEGKVSFAYKNFLGYKKENGEIVIDEEQAIIVRRIYSMFLKEGKTCSGIAVQLKKEGILTPSGNSANWQKNTVLSILTNEKYKGDALLQKTFTANFLEHNTKKNNGQLPQYYVENSHPAVIDKYEWEQLQTELARRQKIGRKYSGSGAFASKLICEDCGGFYGLKVWHSNSKFRKSILQCNRKFDKGKGRCQTPHLTENEVKEMFVRAYNETMKDKASVIEDTEAVIEMLTNTDEVDRRIASLTSEIEIVSELVKKLIRENSSTAQSQDDYQTKYNELSSRYDEAKKDLEEAIQDKAHKQGQWTKLQSFLESLKQKESVLDEWNEELWMIMVEKATVHRDKSITFKFYNGKETTIAAA